jgi:hypothetical protein
MESGVVKIPGFQRNYVWDIGRASRLIESAIIGIPIPQVFLYEESKNSFQVIDGQQRLMTLYYFIKRRFPRKEKRSHLREIFKKSNGIPENILANDEYFTDFTLKLPEPILNRQNPLNGRNYATLDSAHRISLDLRPLRLIIVKQTVPPEDRSVMFEIFNRLNSGGLNLTSQEIRASLYHSKFYEQLYELNLDPRWRQLIGQENPDLHMKDVELLLRGFAMLINNQTYTPSMTKFLNTFSESCKKFSPDTVDYLKKLFNEFLEVLVNLGNNALASPRSGRVNISMYEAIFFALCHDAYLCKGLSIPSVSMEKLRALQEDTQFSEATLEKTTSKKNVDLRLQIAKSILIS